MDPQAAFDRLAEEQSPGLGESAKLVDSLIGESIRRRGSTRPRGTVTTVAEAKVLREAPLVDILDRVASAKQGDVLDAVAAWGGWQVANGIARRLDERERWDTKLRDRAIRALETLGGVRSVEVLAKVAEGKGSEARAALDALEAIASADSAEVDEGGVLPISFDAVDRWARGRALLAHHPLAPTIARLEALEKKSRSLAPRVRAVRECILTAAQGEFVSFLHPEFAVAESVTSNRGEPEPAQ